MTLDIADYLPVMCGMCGNNKWYVGYVVLLHAEHMAYGWKNFEINNFAFCAEYYVRETNEEIGN